MIDFLFWVALHLLALGLIVLAAFGVGSLFVRGIDFHSAPERILFAIVLGFGIWGLALFLLGLAGALYREVIIALTASGALYSLALLIRERRSFRFNLRSLGFAKSLLVVAALACWAFVLWATLYPSTDWDATSNHLALARDYLSTRGIIAHEGLPHPVPPALNHLLFTWAMAISDDIVAQMIEHTLMMMVAFGIYSLGSRRNRPVWGLAAGVFWLAHPLVLWLGQSAYVDIGIVAFSFFGVYALRVFLESREKSWWFLACLLMGMAAGVKMPGLFFIAAGALTGLWARVKFRIGWKVLIRGCALALCIAAPFYAFIAYHTGNPFWPVLPHLSRGIWADAPIAQFNNWIRNVGVAKTPINFLLLPFYLAFQRERFLPEPGFSSLLIFWPTAWIISFLDDEVRWWTLWALAFTAFWFLTSQQVRLLIPALPFMILALYESVRYITEKIWESIAFRKAIWVTAAACAVILILRAGLSLARGGGLPPTNPAARDAFLNRSYGGYGGVRYINERSNDKDAVYVIGGSWLNYYFKPRVIDWMGLVQRSNWPSFRWPDDSAWVRRLESEGVTWILVFYPDHPPWIRIPIDDPVWRPHWPPYELVYEDAQVWVFRHSPG